MGTKQYIEEGTHFLLITRQELFKSRNPQNKQQSERTIVEFEVLETTPLDADQKDQLKVPMTCSLCETEEKQGYAGNVLKFVAGVFGMTTDELSALPDEEHGGGSLDSDNPSFRAFFEGCFPQPDEKTGSIKNSILVGQIVKCVAQKNQAKTYTNKTWSPVPAASYGKWGRVAPPGAYAGPEQAAA
jgi:hypothetical protein